MDEGRIRERLATTDFADVRVVDETGSTNADLLALARTGAPEGSVLVADHQTAGRGRLGRTWEAPPGSSLLVSVLTRPNDPPRSLPVDALHLVSTALGVAASEALSDLTGSEVRLKWPNDLVAEGEAGTRKLSGILAESIVEGDRVTALVVGIGINVNWPAAIPSDLADIATAANHLAGHDLDRADVLVATLERFSRCYATLGTASGQADLLDRYRARSATLGRRVRVELANETIVGDAVDLTADGHLLVVDECPDRLREITVGDVVHLRRA